MGCCVTVKSLKKLDHLSHIGVLLIEPDPFIAHLLKNVLQSLGFTRIVKVANSQEVLDVLSESAIDLIILEWDIAPINGIELTKRIRHLDHPMHRRLPVVMTTGRAQFNDVSIARDAGVTEFIVKPISAKAVLERIQMAIEKPRDFIIAGTYVGPERRRKKKGNTWVSHERRTKTGTSQGGVVVLKADYSLLESIGDRGALRKFFNADAIAKAEKAIAELNDEFLPWAHEDFAEVERRFNALVEAEEQDGADIMELAQAALRIKARAGTFGYNLASSVADLMYKNISERHDISGKWIKIFRAHIQALYVIFHQKVMDTGSDEGQEIIDVLTELIENEKKREADEKKAG